MEYAIQSYLGIWTITHATKVSYEFESSGTHHVCTSGDASAISSHLIQPYQLLF